ncbi:MAG: YkgJ family cysteine cluster protein [Phycisphaerae bacterium]|jgi:Fe-S-cluster containining protein
MAKRQTDITTNCKDCKGLCCKYIALPLDNPETKREYDDIRWYLCHDNVSVFVEDGQWYVSFHTPCRYLSSETKLCSNYEQRPEICREFDSDACEFTQDEYGYELHFTSDEQMGEYIKLKFDNNLTEKGRRKAKK